jgi:hypothetical protein
VWSNNPVQDYYTYVETTGEKSVLLAAGKKLDDIYNQVLVALPAKAVCSL